MRLKQAAVHSSRAEVQPPHIHSPGEYSLHQARSWDGMKRNIRLVSWPRDAFREQRNAFLRRGARRFLWKGIIPTPGLRRRSYEKPRQHLMCALTTYPQHLTQCLAYSRC